MDMTKPGIYIIENKINNKIYLGSTARSIHQRIDEHKRRLKNNKHCSRLLQNEVNQYGISNFTFKVLENIENITKLREIESKWIDAIKPEYNTKGVVKNNIKYTTQLRKKNER